MHNPAPATAEAWPALLRAVGALLSRTPEGLVRSISVDLPDTGDDLRLLAYLCTWMEEQYGVEVTVERRDASPRSTGVPPEAG